MNLSTHLIPIAIRELTTRANRTPCDRRAAEFISARKSKQSGSGTKSPTTALYAVEPTTNDTTEMTDEERVRDYMSNLGEPLTIEQWKQREIDMKELEKLPYEELVRLHKEALGDLF